MFSDRGRENWHIYIKNLLRALKIDTPCIIMTMVKAMVFENCTGLHFKSAIQKDLESGLQDLGFDSVISLYDFGQVLLSINTMSNTYFSGFIMRSKWDNSGKGFWACFKQCPVHTIDRQKESFFGLFKEFEVSNIQSNGVRTGGVLYDKMFQIPV